MKFKNCVLIVKAGRKKRTNKLGEKIRILDVFCETNKGSVVFRMYNPEHRHVFSDKKSGFMFEASAKKTPYLSDNTVPIYAIKRLYKIKEDE